LRALAAARAFFGKLPGTFDGLRAQLKIDANFPDRRP
jgi:hypothetical protein